MNINFFKILFFLSPFSVWAQPANDNCINATELCVNQIVHGATTGASLEECTATNPNGCADDNTPCWIISYATVWYKFTTNSVGGAVLVDFTNVSINPDPTMGRRIQAVVISSQDPCLGLNYNYVSACQNNGLIDFSLSSNLFLAPNTTYYIQVNGSSGEPGTDKPAQVDFDIKISGTAVNVLPVSVQISAANTVICQYDSEPINITFTNCNNSPSFEWYYNGQLIDKSVDFPTKILKESGYLYLKATCGTAGCPQIAESDSIYFDLTPIEVDAGPDLLIQIGETANIEASGIGTPVWSPETGLSAANIFTPDANPDITTTYFLTVTNGVCTLTDEMTVSIKSNIEIPTGFTPNGDGNNDYWEVESLDQYLDNQVIIYDRSGQVIFKTVGYNNATNVWDGTYKGKLAPASTYFYFIDLRNGQKSSTFRGPLTLLR